MKHVVIIEPCSAGYGLIGAAKNQGHFVTVISANTGERVIPHEFKSKIDQLVIVDSNSPQDLLTACEKLDPIDALIPGFEYYVPTCAFIAEQMNLNGIGYATSKAVRFKSEFRRLLLKKGYLHPKFQVISPADSKSLDSIQLKLPVVVKPVDMSGSMGVRKASTALEVQQLVASLQKKPCKDLGQTANGEVILEEYISGNEFSVEGIVIDGHPQIISITKKILGSEPYFIELGHVVGADISEDIKSKIEVYTNQLIRDINLPFGPFHMECRYSPSYGPVAIEVGARLPGDRIVELIKHAKGIDLADLMISLYLGKTFEKLDIAQKSAAVSYFPNPNLKQLNKVSGIDSLGPGTFEELCIYFKPGDDLPQSNDFMSRLGHVIVLGENFPDVQLRLNEVLNKVRFT